MNAMLAGMLGSPAPCAERHQQFSCPAGLDALEAICAVEEIVLADEPLRVRAPHGRKPHAPLAKAAPCDRLADDLRDAAVARIPCDAFIKFVHRHRVAFQHLEEAAVDDQQHAGDVSRGIRAARAHQQVLNVCFAQSGTCAACVNAMNQIHVAIRLYEMTRSMT